MTKLKSILRLGVILLMKLIGIIITIPLLIIIWNYATCPVYDFPEEKPFLGDTFFNPYKNIDPSFWKKGNFQAQSAAWGGITAGQQNSNEEICSIYTYLGYDIIGTSDYQKINTFTCNNKSYLPIYEHGYGIFKNHQILIGAQKVLWKDYPLYQTLSNKQHILDLLKEDNELIFIAHPDFARGNKENDLRYLTSYNGIEFASIYTDSPNYWDAALSSGKYVTAMANDDLHDIDDTNQLGRFCTFINTESTEQTQVIDAMRNGKTFAAALPYNWKESLEKKQKRFKTLAHIQSVQMNADTLSVVISKKVKEIRFIGQEGKLIKSVSKTNKAIIVFGNDENYIRTEFHFSGGTIFYLNPVCRSLDGEMPEQEPAEINQTSTYLKRIILILLLLLSLFVFFRKRK